jgi:hypothetical protein
MVRTRLPLGQNRFGLVANLWFIVISKANGGFVPCLYGSGWVAMLEIQVPVSYNSIIHLARNSNAMVIEVDLHYVNTNFVWLQTFVLFW